MLSIQRDELLLSPLEAALVEGPQVQLARLLISQDPIELVVHHVN